MQKHNNWLLQFPFKSGVRDWTESRLCDIFDLMLAQDIECGMPQKRNAMTKEFIQSRIEIDLDTECWNWLGFLQTHGYGQFRFESKPMLAHRAAWVLWNDQNIPSGLFVCHRCGNPRCVNPDHLFLGTALDNVRDCISKQRNLKGFCKGHLHGRKKRTRKLTDDQVREIRATLYNREPLAVIADRYGVSMATISTIRRGKRKTLIV